MGLDTVELVLAVEERSIREADAHCSLSLTTCRLPRRRRLPGCQERWSVELLSKTGATIGFCWRWSDQPRQTKRIQQCKGQRWICHSALKRSNNVNRRASKPLQLEVAPSNNCDLPSRAPPIAYRRAMAPTLWTSGDAAAVNTLPVRATYPRRQWHRPRIARPHRSATDSHTDRACAGRWWQYRCAPG